METDSSPSPEGFPEAFAEAFYNLVKNPPPPPPNPSPEEKAHHWVLLERAKVAGLSERKGIALAFVLPRHEVVAICELIEVGCDLNTALRIIT
jgi:hypothetical protein